MKTIKFFSIFLILFIANRVSAQQISSADLQVTGLTCSMCSQATEKSLRSLDFISSITPDLNKNLFVITFKKGKAINLDLIKKKVEDAGFSVGGLLATFNFNGVKVDENGQAIANGNVYRFVNAKSKTLNGAIKANVIDKNFISASAFKKRLATVKFDSYANGIGIVNGNKTRIYHLSI